MGINTLQDNIEQKKRKGQDNITFDEEEYYLGLSDVDMEKKKGKDEKEQKIKGLEEKLFEDDSQILGKINSSVFEKVVNPEELKDICKKLIKNGMLEFDENGKIVKVYIEVGGEKRPSELFLSLVKAGFSSEQALKSRLQVRTKSFKNWFGDWENDPNNSSKVVDSNGEPMLLYHSTSVKFDEFDISHFGKTDPGNLGQGFYFSSLLTNGYGKVILPCFLNIRDPFFTSDEYSKSIAFTFGRFGKDAKEQISNKIQELEMYLNNKKNRLKKGIFKFKTEKPKLENEISEIEELLNKLKTHGYNDIVALNNHDGVIQGGFEFVVENPNQIKGVENNGMFSLETRKFNS